MRPHFQLVTIYHRSISIFFDDGIELDELALMILTIFDQFCEFLADSLDVVKALSKREKSDISLPFSVLHSQD